MARSFANSERNFAKAKQVIPGGVNSPVRAYHAVGMTPIAIARGGGSRVYDIDGNDYIDYVLSYGPLILGHAHEAVVTALGEAVANGTSFGAPTELETEMAELVTNIVPSLDIVRMVNSGTEATMSALRVARGYTGRSKIVKFVGCYHGHADSLLIKAGSGVATLGLPDSPGVPHSVAEHTITVPYNDLESVRRAFEAYGEDIAGVIVEPVAGNMGTVLPEPGFLQGLRDITNEYGAVLIFDEVMTGFRVSYSGAQGHFGVTPDLTTLGKVIGGGLPVGAYGGKREIMGHVAPVGPIYQAGTLSGNPLAMTAGYTTLVELGKEGVFDALVRKTEALKEGLQQAADESGIPLQINQIGSMMTMFFSEEPVTNYEQASRADQQRFVAYFRAMIEEGIMLAPSPFETMFLSTAHSDDDIARTIEAHRRALKQLV
ncbi:glutamate-1-semialdehyde 2,1-aminomutase [Numidum massiliense]|uniref:glutamate-1-semialdehyde 2,1-aminomutase n=1 Tax=Numidum massiliense TaxID=1522315 RepID=UPI0006D53688|nr:glutamate-1-semialdehyde 2,1-aminomutase [Numidum massiliense]